MACVDSNVVYLCGKAFTPRICAAPLEPRCEWCSAAWHRVVAVGCRVARGHASVAGSSLAHQAFDQQLWLDAAVPVHQPSRAPLLQASHSVTAAL